MTEIVFAVERGKSLVGRTRFCDYPPEAAEAQVIGGFADPSLELIVALSPTLVCGERGPAGADLPAALEAQGVSTYFPAMDTVADVRAAIEELGRRLDAVDAGRRAATALMERIDAVGRSAPSARPPRVVFLFDWKPLVAAGEESFPGELLALAGAQNAVRGGGKYPKLGVEGLAALDPDVIVDGSGHGDGSLDAAAADPALRAVRAVRDGRIRKLTSTAALRPGPRLGEGVEELARLVRDGSAAASP